MTARRLDSRMVSILMVSILMLVVLAAALALWQYNARDVSGATVGVPGTAIYFIRFDGIVGESKDPSHKGWSDLGSFSQAISRGQSGETRRGGSVDFEDILLVKELDKASPKLAEACATGKVFPTIEIHVARPGTPTYYAYELKNVMVTSYSISGTSSVDDVPEEQVTLSYEEIKVTYTETDEKGGEKGNVEYSWKGN